MKITTIVGTRPELIKMAQVIQLLDKEVEHQLVHTGQNFDYELSEVFYHQLGIRQPDLFLGCSRPTLGESIGAIIADSEKLLRENRPDALVLYGDTNSCLSVISARRLGIPVFHLEAGNRSFDPRVPEETNRKIVDHLSTINCPLTERARQYLLDEGIAPQTIYKSGSLMGDLLDKHARDIEDSQILRDLELEPRKFFVVSSHREENVDTPETLKTLIDELEALGSHYQLPILFSLHPRTRRWLESASISMDSPWIRFSKPLGFFEYNKLQKESLCVLSDSGTLSEESALVGFPAVHLRDCTERPEAVEHGVFVLCPIRSRQLVRSVGLAVSSRPPGQVWRCPVEDYNQRQVPEMILKTVIGFTARAQLA